MYIALCDLFPLITIAYDICDVTLDISLITHSLYIAWQPDAPLQIFKEYSSDALNERMFSGPCTQSVVRLLSITIQPRNGRSDFDTSIAEGTEIGFCYVSRQIADILDINNGRAELVILAG